MTPVDPGPADLEPSEPGPPGAGPPAPAGQPPGPPAFWDAAQIRRVSHQVADLVAGYLTRPAGRPGLPAAAPRPGRGHARRRMGRAGRARRGGAGGLLRARRAVPVRQRPSRLRGLGQLSPASARGAGRGAGRGHGPQRGRWQPRRGACGASGHPVVRRAARLVRRLLRPAGERWFRRDADRARRGPAPGRRPGRRRRPAGRAGRAGGPPGAVRGQREPQLCHQGRGGARPGLGRHPDRARQTRTTGCGRTSWSGWCGPTGPPGNSRSRW